VAERSEIDRWIISELHQTIRAVTEGLEQYDSERPGAAIQEFLEDLSNWYVRRNRKRFYSTGMDSDKIAAYLTLYECLTTLLALLAPFVPFTSEELYQNLVRSVDSNAPFSVHLCDWPQCDETLIDERLTRETHLVMRVVGLGRAAREKAQIKVRQPLNALHVRVTNQDEEEALTRLKEQVLEELNIKQLNLLSADNDMLAYTLKPQVKILGPKYGPLVQKILAKFKALDAHGANEAARQLQASGKLSFTLEGQQIELAASEVEVISTARPGFVATEENGYVVALETTITPELREEGLVRDLTHYIQDMRKKAGFKIEDHIALLLHTDQELAAILRRHQDALQAEILADSLTIVTDPAQAPAINEAYRERVAPDEGKKLESFAFEVVLGRL
jgi:isoleucyl-tRNA synthetase